MIERETFDDDLTALMRLRDDDQTDLWSQVAPNRWTWTIPLAAAAAALVIAWQVTAPVTPNAWPLDGQVVAVDRFSVPSSRP